MKKFLTIILVLTLVHLSTAKAYAEELEINKEMVILKSRLKGDYTGYKYHVTNKTKGALEIVNAQLINGQDGSIASDAVADGSGVGTMWAIMGPAGLFSLGITWLVGIVATPVMLVTDNARNSKARKEGANFSNIVDLGLLASGQSVEVNTLVRKGAQPQLKISYKRPSSSEIKFISN